MIIETFITQGLQTHKEQSELCIKKLIELCEKYYGYRVDREKILKNQHGKPYIADEHAPHFNISHTKGMAAIVLDNKECGVDIEKIRDIKLSMADRFFSDDEKAWVKEASNELESKERFFTVWTGKEAYTKKLGIGLTIPMDSFSVLKADIKDTLKYEKIEEYIICVCSDSEKLC